VSHDVLGTGDPTEILVAESIKTVDVLDFKDLGMEAIWKIEVVDRLAPILVDDNGHGFFRLLTRM
jgi:fumarate hydratase class I